MVTHNKLETIWEVVCKREERSNIGKYKANPAVI